jgi:hypothetical protein
MLHEIHNTIRIDWFSHSKVNKGDKHTDRKVIA